MDLHHPRVNGDKKTEGIWDYFDSSAYILLWFLSCTPVVQFQGLLLCTERLFLDCGKNCGIYFGNLLEIWGQFVGILNHLEDDDIWNFTARSAGVQRS